MKKVKRKNYIDMKKSARTQLSILAVFLITFCSGFAYQQNNGQISKIETSEVSGDFSGFKPLKKNFKPLQIPEINNPKQLGSVAMAAYTGGNPQVYGYAAGIVANGTKHLYSEEAYDGVTTARDPRFEAHENSYKVPFIPASETRPPAPSISIPVVDTREPMHYDLNEWEEDRFFSSNLYTDTSFYTTHVSGNKELAPDEDGEFYEENMRYELFSTNKKGDTLSLIVDGTFSNDHSYYKHSFVFNQFTFDVANDRSRLVLGHAFPEMSELSMTQNVLGIYGSHRFDSTSVSAFGGYYETEKEDLDNPRYIGGFRFQHSRDESLKLGLNVVGTEDERDNPAASNEQPSLSNRLVSMDVNMKPTENIFLNAEVAHSDTDFDKRDDTGKTGGNAYIFKGGYERENFRAEGGIEYADSDFATPLGESPRDDRSYYARFFYELNKYVSTRIGYKESRDNIDNYLRSTVKRTQDEFQITVKPSEYYKNLRIDLYYQPIHEFEKNKSFMDRYIDLYWIEMNQKAGEMEYYAGFSKTIDRDEIENLNDRDIERMDLKLTWEKDDQHKVYGTYSIENIDYKLANNTERTKWSGLGGSTKLNQHLTLGIDYLREDVNSSGICSIHDKVNLSLTREYNPSTRLILDLSGSRTDFDNDASDYDDYTAKLRLLKTF